MSFWRGTTDVHGHVKAGAQVVAAALLAQARSSQAPSSPSTTPTTPEQALEQVHRMLPGLGDPTPVVLDGSDAAVGQTIGQLQLRSVALVGSHGAIDAATAVLTTRPPTVLLGDETG